MRPIYETKEDEDRDHLLSLEIADLWNIKVHKNPKFHPIDYSAGHNGQEIDYWMEFKSRGPDFDYALLDRLGGFMVPADKVTKWRTYLAISQLPVVLCISLSGDKYYMKYNPKKRYRFKVMGRKDRNDPADIFPHILFPMKDFKPLLATDNLDFLYDN